MINSFQKNVQILTQKKANTIIRYTNYVENNGKYTILHENYLQKRISLIDLEANTYQSRIDRLKLDDDFSETINKNQKRPVALNEKGSKIYEDLEEEDELVDIIPTPSPTPSNHFIFFRNFVT